MTAALDRAVANALGLKSVNNCEKWSKTMIEDDNDIQVYKKPWVGLTDEEIAQGNKESWVDEQAWQSAVWWAEEILKRKNT
jgi:hypothetical protein